MADTKISAFTDGATANATDRIAAARSPFAADSDNRYLTPTYIKDYILGLANTWTLAQTFTQNNSAPVIVSSASSTTGFGSISGDPAIWNTNTVAIRVAATSPAVLGAVQIGASASSPDVFLTRVGAATLQLGNPNAASPVAQTVQAQGSRSGTDTNVGGANVTLASGQGTGTGTISSLALQSPVAVASGTGAQTMTTGITIKAGAAVLTSYVVSGLPAAATAGAGATAFVTDASTTLILGLGLAVTGSGSNKVPVYSDGTSWLYG